MWVTHEKMQHCLLYDPRMKREGLHYVVVERDEKYMARILIEMVPGSSKWTKHWLREIGFVFEKSNGDDPSSIISG